MLLAALLALAHATPLRAETSEDTGPLEDTAPPVEATGGQDRRVPLAPRAADHGAVTHPGLAARIEVLDGRVRLLASERIEALFAHSPPLLVEGPAHLDVRAGGIARVTWPGQGSVLVHGPAAFEWRARATAGGNDPGDEAALSREALRTFRGRELELDVLDLGHLDVEARRGALEVTLPGAWRTRVERTAVQLRSTSGGAVELTHHAGPTLRLEWLGSRSETRPPLDVPAGSSVRLDRPKPPPRSSLAEDRHEAWPDDEGAWPWRSVSDTPETAARRAATPCRTQRLDGWAPDAAGPVTHVEVVDGRGRSRFVPLEAPATRPTEGTPRPGAPSEPRRRRVPVAPPVEVEGPALTPADAPAPHDDATLPGIPGTLGAQASGDSASAPGDETHPETAAGTLPETGPLGEAGPLACETAAIEPTTAVEPPADGGSGTVRSQGGQRPELGGGGLQEALKEEPGGPEAALPHDPAGSPPMPVTSPSAAAAAPPDGEAQPQTASLDPARWRGRPPVALVGAGPVRVERRTGVEVRALAGGRVRVLVDPSVTGPVHAFVLDQDYRLAPGATLVLEPDGRERLRMGGVELLPTP